LPPLGIIIANSVNSDGVVGYSLVSTWAIELNSSSSTVSPYQL
jgi:hypothetical protein